MLATCRLFVHPEQSYSGKYQGSAVLTLDDLKRASSLMDAYGETRAGYLDTDAARHSGPLSAISHEPCAPEHVEASASFAIELVQDPATQAWRIVRR